MSHTKRAYNDSSSSVYVHPFNQVCMGRCPSCRDPKKEQKTIRKQRKAETKLEYENANKRK